MPGVYKSFRCPPNTSVRLFSLEVDTERRRVARCSVAHRATEPVFSAVVREAELAQVWLNIRPYLTFAIIVGLDICCYAPGKIEVRTASQLSGCSGYLTSNYYVGSSMDFAYTLYRCIERSIAKFMDGGVYRVVTYVVQSKAKKNLP